MRRDSGISKAESTQVWVVRVVSKDECNILYFFVRYLLSTKIHERYFGPTRLERVGYVDVQSLYSNFLTLIVRTRTTPYLFV